MARGSFGAVHLAAGALKLPRARGVGGGTVYFVLDSTDISPLAAGISSRSTSFAKHLPVSSWMQLHRGRQEVCRIHLVSNNGPRRVTRALCELVERGALSTCSLDCATEGVKLAQLCSFPMDAMYWNWIRVVRHVAWEAANPQSQANIGDESSVATKSTAAQKLIMAILEMEGGAHEIHFRRNLEVLVLSHMFTDHASSSAAMLAVKSDLFAMALSLMTKMMNRVIADGVPQSEQKPSAHDSSLEKLEQACRRSNSPLSPSPSLCVLQEGCGWQCTAVYTAHARFSILMSVTGEGILIKLFSALSSAFIKPLDPASTLPLSSAIHNTTGRELPKLQKTPGLGMLPLESPLKVTARFKDSPSTPTSSLKSSTVKSPEPASSPSAQIIKHRLVQTGKVREGESNVRSIDRLLNDHIFKFPASDMLGPLIVKHLSVDVLNGFLDVLEACSASPRAKSEATSSTSATPRHGGIRQLAFAMVDRGYLSDERGRLLLEAAVYRWPVRMPRQVLALVSRIALRDASLAAQQQTDSPLVMLLWNASLASLDVLGDDITVPLADAESAETTAEVAVSSCSSVASSSPVLSAELLGPTKLDSKKLAVTRNADTSSRPVLHMDHARVLVLLFTTLTEQKRGELLIKTVDMLERHALKCHAPGAPYTSGPPSPALMGLLPLVHYTMYNFSQPCDSLVCSIESFLCGEAQASDEKKRSTDWGVSSVECLLRFSIDDPDRAATIKSLDMSQMEVLNLSWMASQVDVEAVRVLQAADDRMARLVESTQLVMQHSLFKSSPQESFLSSLVSTPQMLGYRDQVIRAAVLQSACLFNKHVHESLLSVCAQPATMDSAAGAHEAVHGAAPQQAAAILRYLLGLRGKLQRSVQGGSGQAAASKLLLREIVDATDVIAKSWTCRDWSSSSSGDWSSESCMPLVCLDALLALLRLLLCGTETSCSPERQDVNIEVVDGAGLGAGRDGVGAGLNHLDTGIDEHSQHVLEDLDGVMACIHKCLSLVVSCWAALDSAANAVSTTSMPIQGANWQVRQAALGAGLPVEASTSRATGVRNKADSMRTAVASFCASQLQVPTSSGPQGLPSEACSRYLEWDAQVQASLVLSVGKGTQGLGAAHGQLATAVNLTCRVAEVISALGTKLVTLQQATKQIADTASSQSRCGRQSTMLDTSIERLLVLMADVTTDERLHLVHSQCEAWLHTLSVSEEIQQQHRDLSSLRRVDTFLQVLGTQQLHLEANNASVTYILEHCIKTVRQLVNHPKRSTAMVMFYLDNPTSTVNKSPLPTIPIHCIDEALPEGIRGKGKIAALLHILVLSSDPKIIRDLVLLLRGILEKPASAALARLKPTVRRNIAEALGALRRPQVCPLSPLSGMPSLSSGLDTLYVMYVRYVMYVSLAYSTDAALKATRLGNASLIYP